LLISYLQQACLIEVGLAQDIVIEE